MQFFISEHLAFLPTHTDVSGVEHKFRLVVIESVRVKEEHVAFLLGLRPERGGDQPMLQQQLPDALRLLHRRYPLFLRHHVENQRASSEAFLIRLGAEHPRVGGEIERCSADEGVEFVGLPLPQRQRVRRHRAWAAVSARGVSVPRRRGFPRASFRPLFGRIGVELALLELEDFLADRPSFSGQALLSRVHFGIPINQTPSRVPRQQPRRLHVLSQLLPQRRNGLGQDRIGALQPVSIFLSAF
mmetsp:Transcript_14053/g.25389  ORF Transcript_14053/g.25389 Transcript_14053/m.25389 type:complete len:243 (+) Transcript_14053:463-1191(+)